MKTKAGSNLKSNIGRSFLVLISIFAVGSHLRAQQVMSTKQKYGLVSDSGKKILDSIYDDVEPIGHDWPLFTYTKGDKIGLYNVYDSTLYPCEYDEVVYEYYGFMIRKGNKFGYITCERPLENQRYNFMYKVIEPVYDSVIFNGYEICVEKGSLYGLVSRNVKPVQIIPCEMPAPIYRNEDYGYYYITKKRTRVILRQDSQTKTWTGTEFQNEPKLAGSFLMDENELTGEIAVYDKETCRIDCYFPPVTDSVKRFFSWEGMCVEEDIKRGTHVRVNWYDPFDGQLFFTIELKDGDNLSCLGYRGSMDFSEEQKVYVLSHRHYREIDTYVGALNGYNYTAYETPEVEKRERDKPHHSWGRGPTYGKWNIFWIGGR